MSKPLPEMFLHRTFAVTERASDGKRTVRVIASTESIDSYDDVVEADWDLSRYEKNPVVLYGHNRSGVFGMGGAPEDSLPIGYATDVTVRAGKLQATLHFVDEKANPIAPKVWEGFQQGSIRAVSVGFKPKNVRQETRDGKEVFVLSGNELFEISVVPIGANPDAVALSARAERQRWFNPGEALWNVELPDGGTLPLSAGQIRSLTSSGKLHGLCHVQRVGESEGHFLRDVQELQLPPLLFPSAAAPAPAPAAPSTERRAGSAIVAQFRRSNPTVPVPPNGVTASGGVTGRVAKAALAAAHKVLMNPTKGGGPEAA